MSDGPRAEGSPFAFRGRRTVRSNEAVPAQERAKAKDVR